MLEVKFRLTFFLDHLFFPFFVDCVDLPHTRTCVYVRIHEKNKINQKTISRMCGAVHLAPAMLRSKKYSAQTRGDAE